MSRRIVGMLLFATLCACTPAPSNQEAVVDNGLNAEGEAVEVGDDRADHLDEAAQEALDASNQASGTAKAALRNQATADLSEADAARAQGQAAGAQAEDEAETSILNKR